MDLVKKYFHFPMHSSYLQEREQAPKAAQEICYACGKIVLLYNNQYLSPFIFMARYSERSNLMIELYALLANVVLYILPQK